MTPPAIGASPAARSALPWDAQNPNLKPPATQQEGDVT